jgi:SAM-dependent methyltransferase
MTDARQHTPPPHLMPRIGSVGAETFRHEGKVLKDALSRCFPPGMTLEPGMRILDFGCGAGRLESQLLDESRTVEIWGCDIDEESIAWATEQFGPQFHFFRNDAQPPLDVPPEHFDLVLALSVFTHIPNGWQAWLEEIRRVLRPGGLAFLSFLSVVPFAATVEPPDRLEAEGMVVDGAENDWSVGGPQVYQTNGWVLEHWSRVLPVRAIFDEGLGFQSLAVAGKERADGPPLVVQPFVRQYPREGYRGFVDYDPWRTGNWWLECGWCAGNGTGALPGWFVSDHAPLRSIHAVGPDGREIPIEHTLRPDVAAAYSKVRWAIDSGFTISPDALRGMGPGRHRVTITSTDWSGRAHWMRIQTTIRKEKTP